MATTHDPYESVKYIYNLKNDWDKYNQAGDTANQPKTAEAAQKHYQDLINNGYSSVAEDLSKSNYANAKSIYDKYATAGKTQANSYLGTLGKSYGLNQAQIDALLSTNAAGEVTFGGNNIGSAYSNVDGLSYWDSTDTLDNAFNDYVSRAGLSKSFDTQYNQNNQDIWNTWNRMMNDYGANAQAVNDKSNQLWNTMNADKGDMSNRYSRLEDFNYSNPFTTDTGKSVLERYDLAGLQGRDNQAAMGGANNGGNIDSYSAANALRQQAALRNLGEQSALAAHSRTVNDGRGILSDREDYYKNLYDRMTGAINADSARNSADTERWLNLLNTGMTHNNNLFADNETKNNREFNQDQTAKNNALNREVITSQTTGNVPTTMLMREYGLIDENGNLKNTNMDYHAKINELNARLANTTDPKQQQDIQNQISAYTAARTIKTGMSEYQQYVNDIIGGYYAPVANTTTNQFNETLAQKKYETDTAAELTREGYTTEKTMNADNNATIKYGIDTNAGVEKYAQDLNYDVTIKGYDVQKYLQDNEIAFGKYKVDADKEISMEEISMENISLQKLLGLESIYVQERMNSANLSSAEKQLLAQLASNEKVTFASLSSQEKQTLAQLSSSERINSLNLNAQQAMLIKQLASNEKISADNNATNIAMNTANNAATKTRNDDEIEFNKWLAGLEASTAASSTNAASANTKTTTVKPVMSMSEMNKEIENGNITPEVKNAYKYYHGVPLASDDDDWYGINRNSVTQLGEGPISLQRLEELIRSGEVIATKQNGEIYVERAK